MDGRPGWRFLAVALAVGVSLGLACAGEPASPGDGGPPPPGDDGPVRRYIRHEGAWISVPANASAHVPFFLFDQYDRPVPDQQLQFYITDPSATQGATLERDRAVTDPNGVATLQINGGRSTTFRLAVEASFAERLFVLVAVGPR